jgi:3-carboxy-cis,cis-muconate cycloisomerase
MGDLLWPGDERAGDLMSDSAMLNAMVRVESSWLRALVDLKVAGPDAASDLSGLVTEDDLTGITDRSEAGGNPVIPLLELLRTRLAANSPAAARWLHRGLTSQDVMDTALVLCAGVALDRLHAEIDDQVSSLMTLADRHRGAVMAGRTLTQHAVPISFGLKAAMWLQGLLDAADLPPGRAGLPGQFAGAAGTMAAATELAALSGHDDPPGLALDLAAHASRTLGLRPHPPWHTSRHTFTGLGDLFVACTDAWGRIANDVLTLSRPEIAELAEPAADGRGSSSAMPQKVNPVLSVLVRRAALTAPLMSAQLHLAAAEARDERPDGAWHTEWSTLATLTRRTVVAAAQMSEIVSGLTVDTERMRAAALTASTDLLLERRTLSALFDDPAAGQLDIHNDVHSADPAGYLGANDLIIDAVLERAGSYLRGSS